MDTPIKILVVEDEMLIGAKISMLLSDLGYEVTGILPRGEDELTHVESNPPDILLLDVHLKGAFDGIETAARLQQSPFRSSQRTNDQTHASRHPLHGSRPKL